MEPIIRPVKSSDLTTVHKLEVGSYPDPWPRSIFFLMKERAPDLFLVAEVNGEVVGYAIGEVEWSGGERIGHVMNIAIASEWRRKGLGGKLLDELEGRFRGKNSNYAYLEVRVSNAPAQSLYRKRGYKAVSILPGYYRDENGVAMEKPLR